MSLPIKGLERMSLIDFPPYTSCVVFIAGCNFRCPFCQNVDLVKDSGTLAPMPEQEVLAFLDERRKWLDAVVITGGEPTIHENLPDFLARIKDKGYMVKLDTNGSNPGMLRELMDKKLIDSVSMDIKAPLAKYKAAAGTEVDASAIQESAGILLQSSIDYEFRTTVVPDFFSEDDAHAIGKWLKGAKRYSLQQFRTEMGTLDPDFRFRKPYPKDILQHFQQLLKNYIDNVNIKGF